MAQHALGDVRPASTIQALRATNNAPALINQLADQNYSVQALQFQALSTNTGSVYICDREIPTLSLHVLAEVPAPSTSTPSTRPAWTIGDPSKAAAFDARTFWILPAVSGDGVRVTVVR